MNKFKVGQIVELVNSAVTNVKEGTLGIVKKVDSETQVMFNGMKAIQVFSQENHLKLVEERCFFPKENSIDVNKNNIYKMEARDEEGDIVFTDDDGAIRAWGEGHVNFIEEEEQEETYKTLVALPFIEKGYEFTKTGKETDSDYTTIQELVKDECFEDLVGIFFEKEEESYVPYKEGDRIVDGGGHIGTILEYLGKDYDGDHTYKVSRKDGFEINYDFNEKTFKKRAD